MGMIEDIMKALERIPAWKRISALPAEVDALTARIAALEQKLGPQSGKQCPICNEFALKVIASAAHPDFGFAGVQQDTMKCSKCGHQEVRSRDPAKK